MVVKRHFLFSYILKYWYRYILGIGFLIMCQYFQASLPKLISKAVDLINSYNFSISQIFDIAKQMILYSFIIALGRWGWRFFLGGSARNIQKNIRETIFNHLLSLDDRFFKKNKIGDLMTNFTSDLNMLRQASSIGVVHVIEALFMLTIILFFLFKESPTLALYIIIPYPFITIAILIVGTKARNHYQKIQKQAGVVSQHVQDVFSGVRIVKTFTKESYFISLFEQANKLLQKLNLNIIMMWEITWPTISFLIGSTQVFIMIFGGKMVLKGDLTLGQLTMAMSYIWMLLGPFMSIGWAVQIMQRASISAKRIYDLLRYEPLVQNPSDGMKHYPQGDIEFKNLSFVYHDGNSEVLKNINLKIEKGQIVGILGSLASGKSTLIKAMTKTIDIKEDQIFYDGIDIVKYDLDHLRKGIGIVPQVSFLFSDTIKNNINFAIDTENDSIIDHVSGISTLNRDLRLFSQGFETEVGERGVSLSGGQKQRVAIARALASEPNILILDDSMSAVDTETEEKILSSIYEERNGKTTILISYRISTLKKCDNIFVLKDGELIESGKHKELIEKGGFYKKISDLQSLKKGLD